MPKGVPKGKRHKAHHVGSPCVLIDYDTFNQCYKEWCEGKIGTVEFGKRCNVSYNTIRTRLIFMYTNGYALPEWFSKADGTEMFDDYNKDKVDGSKQ